VIIQTFLFRRKFIT